MTLVGIHPIINPSSHKYQQRAIPSRVPQRFPFSTTRTEDLAEKMKEFIEYNEGPILMEAVVTKGEHVLPMVPAGKAFHQFLVHGMTISHYMTEFRID